MRARTLVLVLVGCTSHPPPLNPEAGMVTYDAMYSPPREGGVLEAGADGGPINAVYMDYEGICPNGYQPVWRFHDFMTKTPGDSSIDFSAQSAAAIGDFATAPSVHLAKVTGPDITVWTGVDVDPKLKAIGEKSLHFLRVTTLFQAGEAGAPTLVNVRQQYDCTVNQ